MGRVLKLLFWSTLLLVLLSPVAAYYLLLSERPMALPAPTLDQERILHLQRMLSQQRSQTDGDGVIVVELGEDDLNTAINYGQQTMITPLLQGMVVEMAQEDATVRGSFELPIELERRFVNFHARLAPHDVTPGFLELGLGYVSVPAWLLSRLESTAIEQLHEHADALGLRQPLDAIQHIGISDYRLQLAYQARNQLGASVAAAPVKRSLEDIDQALVETYLAYLEPISHRPSGDRYPLIGLLAPAFELARERTRTGEKPALENVAALIALALYGADPAVLELTGLDDRFGYPPRSLALTVNGRKDLAKHYLTSALIYVIAGDQVAALAGMQKELDDAQTRSGFDLADLIADKAGIRLAELATASAESAARLQSDAAQLLYDDDLLPTDDTLPQLDITARLAEMDDEEAASFLEHIDRQARALLSPLALYRL